MIRHFLNMLLIVNLSLAQDSLKNKKIYDNNIEYQKDSFSESNLIDKSTRISKGNLENFKNSRIENLEFRYYNESKTKIYSFDLISSMGSNISFGGFWEGYAVVNFTPQLYIKPVGFLSIYANHYLNCFVPLNGIKEYSQSIILQSLAVLAVDNSMKLFLAGNSNWIMEMVSFTAKNLLLNLLIKPAITNSTKNPFPILHYENYYYSMNINF